MYSTFGRLLYYGTALEKAAFSPLFVWTQWLETDTSSLYAWDGSSWLTISVPTGLSGSGTPGIISQWTGANSLGDSTLKKTGAGLLELVSAGAYTLTIPTSGTAALGAGTVTSSSSNDTTIANHTHALDNVGPGATGPIGSATVVPIVTIDAKGRVTGLTSTTIAGVAPFAHDILSAYHGDTLADAVVRGDLIVGNATPKWARLAKGTANAVLQPTATDVAWSSGFLSIASGKTLTVNNTITLAATADGYTLTIPGTGTALLEATAATTYLKLDASNDPVTGDLDINAALTVGVTRTSPNLGVTGRVVIDADSNATVTPALDVHMHPYTGGVGQWMGIFSKVTTVAGQPAPDQAGALYTVLYHNAGYTLPDWRGIETGGAYVYAGSSITMASGLYAALPNAWEFGGSVGTAAAIWMPGSNSTGIGTVWSILQTGAAPSYWNGTFNMEDNSLPIDAWRSGGATQMRFSDYVGSATAGPRLLLRHSRGTYALPTDVSSGDQGGLLIFDQYINGAFRQGAYIGTLAGTTISGTSYPMIMDFRVVPEGSTVNTRHMTIANKLVSIFNDLTVQHTTSWPTIKLSSGDTSINAGDKYGKLQWEENDGQSVTNKITGEIWMEYPPTTPGAIGSDVAPGEMVFATTLTTTPTEWFRIKATGAATFLSTAYTTFPFAVNKTSADFFDDTSLGAELVTNGDFSSATGWTATACTLDVSGGTGKLTATGANYRVGQALTTVANRLYKMTVSWLGTQGTITSASSIRILIGTVSGGSTIAQHFLANTNNLIDTSYTVYFVATGTTTWIGLFTNTNGTISVWDDVSVKEVTGGNVISRGIFGGGGTTGIKVYSTGEAQTVGRKQAVAVKSANYTLTVNDEVVVVTATCTQTLPAATGSGQTYRICNEGAAGVVVTIDGNSTDTVKGELTQILYPGEDLILTDYKSGGWC